MVCCRRGRWTALADGLMTALTMPSDYGLEMMLGSSPVLTSGFLPSHHSPFIHDFSRVPPLPPLWPNESNNPSPFGAPTTAAAPGAPHTVFANSLPNNNSDSSFVSSFDYHSNNTYSSRRSRRSPPRKTNNNNNSLNNSFNNLSLSSCNLRKFALAPLDLLPTKSCLVTRQEEEVDEGAVSPTRLKKKVVFADTRGRPLAEVRLLTERPDCPPRWTADFLEQVTRGAKAEAVTDHWELSFPQPASDYLAFKARLDNNNVSLENVVINEADSGVTGTVKVRNLDFHKTVTVRYTVDSWTTTSKITCEYVPSATTATGISYDLYDTFKFDFPLPTSGMADKVEFCVCFSCQGQEYWDNNNSKNYVLVSFRPKTSTNDCKPNDVYNVTMDSWSEFASWNHLTLNDTPYW
ncbi:protein phosphatase 1 regulatory subunit 3B-like isoform X2 [Oratosquilla oratoria]|uniref:protein phosphatase 1 regulatory subunit 3B-like isoform X2 n=1 Tax=Oratosquilla oratoria TaxID=337810 RepID=UPI003F76AC79